jgi:hypothetical protein
MYSCSKTQYGDKFVDKPTISKIAFEVDDPILDRGYTIYLDNWFNSPDPADKLCQRKTDCIGMRLNKKGVLEKVKVAKLKKGDSVAAFRRKQMFMKWKDKKDVTLVSTMHKNCTVPMKRRRGKL